MEPVNGRRKPSTAAPDAHTTAFIVMANPWRCASGRLRKTNGAPKEFGNMMWSESIGNTQAE